MADKCESCRRHRDLDVVIVQGQPFAVCGECRNTPETTYRAVVGQQKKPEERDQG